MQDQLDNGSINLTITELDKKIMQHLREKKSNSDIASSLNLSLHSVQFFVNNLLRKTQCRDIEALVSFSYTLDIK